MGWMFNNCSKLKKLIGLENFNTIKLVHINEMFQECQTIDYLNLSSFNTSNIINMEGMFSKCFKLKQIQGLDKFNIINVTNIKYEFII